MKFGENGVKGIREKFRFGVLKGIREEFRFRVLKGIREKFRHEAPSAIRRSRTSQIGFYVRLIALANIFKRDKSHSSNSGAATASR